MTIYRGLISIIVCLSGCLSITAQTFTLTGRVLDENGDIVYELDENVVSFYEATTRATLGLPIIDKDYKKEEGWQFQFTMKQNEYFVFPRYDADGNMACR